jgi:hypothetical protein
VRHHEIFLAFDRSSYRQVMKTRALHRNLVDAYRTANRKRTLALVADWPTKELGRAMNADAVRATPLMVTRLTNLAEALGYSGALFADEVEAK